MLFSCYSRLILTIAILVYDHVSADSVGEFQENFDAGKQQLSLADYNLPKEKICPYIYMTNYMRLPPDWSGPQIPEDMFLCMRFCQPLINASTMLPS
jgi:hypothetical protein